MKYSSKNLERQYMTDRSWRESIIGITLHSMFNLLSNIPTPSLASLDTRWEEGSDPSENIYTFYFVHYKPGLHDIFKPCNTFPLKGLLSTINHSQQWEEEGLNSTSS